MTFIKHFYYLLIVILLHTTTAWGQIGSKVVIENMPLQTTNGGSANFSLSQYAQKECVVLIFTSHECAYDQAFQLGIEDALEYFAQETKVAFVLINPQNEDNQVQKLQELQYKKPYFLDKNHQLATQLQVTKTPDVRIFQNNNGNFILKYQGLIDNSAEGGSDNFLIIAIEAILLKQPVAVPIQDPIGCGIQ